MPRACSVVGCGNVVLPNQVALFAFPSEDTLRSAWVDFLGAEHFKSKLDRKAYICNVHFEVPCFANYRQWRNGLATKLILVPNSIPSIVHPETEDVASTSYKIDNQSEQEVGKKRARQSEDGIEHTKEKVTSTENKFTRKRNVKVQCTSVNQVCSKGIQVQPEMRSVATQCNLSTPVARASTPVCSDDELDISDIGCTGSSIYLPDEEDFTLSETNTSCMEGLYVSEKKFIVFKSCLWELFSQCPMCNGHCSVEEKLQTGTQICVFQACNSCGYVRNWSSQPSYGNIPAGNLQLAGSIFFNGASCRKVVKTLQSINISCFSETTYYNHAASYLQPTVYYVWKSHQTELLEQLSQMHDGLVLGTDGRSDSPGHSAKYGSYSVIEERINKVIDIQLVQCNEVANSNAMEKEGLIRSCHYLQNAGLDIAVLIIDRHLAIQKWIRESLPDVKHYFDVWHVAKGFSKKATSLSLQKGCEQLAGWVKSMSNHMYWCASSASDDNRDLVLAKWLSITNHMQNIHDGHSDLFPSCAHEDLGETARHKQWIKPGTKALEKLEQLVNDKNLCKAVKKLSPYHQTSNVEAFHALILQFCPKMTAFSYKGMLCRLLLAALHYNENSDRPQAVTSDGKSAFSLKYPKYKKGGYIIRTKKTAPTYGYIEILMKTLCDDTVSNNAMIQQVMDSMVVPGPMCEKYQHPDKEVAVAQYCTRYNT